MNEKMDDTFEIDLKQLFEVAIARIKPVSYTHLDVYKRQEPDED